MREIEAAIQERLTARAYRRILSYPDVRAFMASYGLDRVAAWAASVAVVTLSYRLTEDVGVVAIFVLAQVLARLFIGSTGEAIIPQGRWTLVIASVVRILAVGSLMFVSSSADLGWALVATGLMSGASCVIEATQSRLGSTVGPLQELPVCNRLIGRVEQFSAVGGPVLAGLILFAASEAGVFALAVLLFAGMLTLLHRRGWLVVPAADDAAEQTASPAGVSFERFRHPVLRLVAAGLIAVAALGAVIRVALIDVVVDHLEYPSGSYGLLLSLVGLGALVGPLPIHKLLGRIGIGFVVTGSVIAFALGMVILGFTTHVVLIIPILLASGVLVITSDLVAAVTLRRLVPEDELAGITRAAMVIVVGGQLVGLIAVLGLSQLWGSGVVVTLVAAAWVVALMVIFVSSNGPRLALATIVASTHHSLPEDGDAK